MKINGTDFDRDAVAAFIDSLLADRPDPGADRPDTPTWVEVDCSSCGGSGLAAGSTGEQTEDCTRCDGAGWYSVEAEPYCTKAD